LAVEGAQGIEAVALQTPPRALILSRASEQATAAVVEFVLATKLTIPGVIAPLPTAQHFVALWTKRTGRTAMVRVPERLYELSRVQSPANVPGGLREAEVADEPFLAKWATAFIEETNMDPIPDGLVFVRGKRAARQLFVWEDEALVSMAAWMGRTTQGVRVGYVYTPPAHRRRGYASALVAALSQRLLDEGSPRCFLFTNANNPTSNRIYQRIGYEFVCDFWLYDFSAE